MARAMGTPSMEFKESHEKREDRESSVLFIHPIFNGKIFKHLAK